MQKANIARHPWCCLVDKMMEWLEIHSFSVYMGNWKHWHEKVAICIWWIWVGWSKPMALFLWCGSMCLLHVHSFKGENLLFLEYQSKCYLWLPKVTLIWSYPWMCTCIQYRPYAFNPIRSFPLPYQWDSSGKNILHFLSLLFYRILFYFEYVGWFLHILLF